MAAVVTDRQGQFRVRRTFEFANLGELPRNKTRWQVGNIARDVVQWLQDQGVQALVIEDLNINRGGGSARYNRRTVPFAYRQLTESLVRRALRAGMVVKRVNPAYTSWIGQLKYAGQYGVSTHTCRLCSAGNTRPGVGPDSRSGPLSGTGTAFLTDTRQVAGQGPWPYVTRQKFSVCSDLPS